MAWYSETSVITFGRYKGLKVKDIDDKMFIDRVHHSKLNVYFTDEVLDRLNIENKGKSK